MNLEKLLKRQKEAKAKLFEKKANELRKKIDKMLLEEDCKLGVVPTPMNNGILYHPVILPLSKDELKVKELKNKSLNPKNENQNDSFESPTKTISKA